MIDLEGSAENSLDKVSHFAPGTRNTGAVERSI
jgi:hypothetical protein